MTDYKKDFPLLAGSDIAYLDNAATAQRPEAVLKAVEDFYTKKNANPLRGLYELGIEATEAYEAARERVREFINAGKTSEVVFTRNSTESLNLIAYSYGLTSLKAGDEILISIDNHHSNILPWQMVSRQTGAKLVYLECQPDGSYRDEDMEAREQNGVELAEPLDHHRLLVRHDKRRLEQDENNQQRQENENRQRRTDQIKHIMLSMFE